MSRTRVSRASLALAVAFLCSGCMFKVAHELPPNTYFGKLPGTSTMGARNFEREGHKNWALAGFVPYSNWATKDLLEDDADLRRIEQLEIETTFNTFDTVVWVIPGFAYGYYVWAPRTIKVTGVEIRGEGAEQ